MKKIVLISFTENFTLEGNAMRLLILEIFGICIIILLLFVAYFAVNDIIKCITNTKQKLI